VRAAAAQGRIMLRRVINMALSASNVRRGQIHDLKGPFIDD